MKKTLPYIFLITSLLNLNLYSQKLDDFEYTGKYLKTLRVPIGGIGTGNILVGGRGNIEHVEVFNRPDRNRRLMNTFFALWVKEGDNPPVTKLLEREFIPPYTENSHQYATGLPRMREVTYTNTYPLPKWEFTDDDISLKVSMEAYNPFIPLDLDNSSFPVAVFDWSFTNQTPNQVSASIVLNMENPIVADQLINALYDQTGTRGIRFVADSGATQNYQGEIVAFTSSGEANIQTHLYPGRWRDDMHVFWNDFSKDGIIESVDESWETAYRRVGYNEITNRNSLIQISFTLSPGESIKIPYYIAWYFPDRVFTASETFGTEGTGKVFGNYYKTLFNDVDEVVSSFLKEKDVLYQMTSEFSRILNETSFSSKVVQGLSSQASTIKTNLIQVTEDRDVHGFEGVTGNGWCCPGTCTHVWNYEHALAYLYPSMERNMRELEFLHNTFENGFQSHRTVFPLGDYYFNGGAAADGQMGSIIRVYREWKLSGDSEWLAKIWPKVKKALEFAWYGPGKVSEERFKYQESQTPWDPDKDGIMTGRQHNTYDISFFGPSSMTTSCYLAALKACSEMAMAMDEPKKSKEYLKVYNTGVKKMENMLWNGEYFVQIIAEDPNADLQDDYELSPPNEKGERLPKYQYGDGSLADQLLGQFLAHTSGLGYILDQEKVDQAVHSIYKYNFIPEMRDYANVQRVYALNDESGVVLCAWPNNNQPILPFVYAQEVWTGVEYQVAASLIYSGYVKEGIEITEAVQDRYDGFKRNPFEHDESGVHYARAMSSWAVLLALSGFDYDGVEKSLSFSPQINKEKFNTFWSTGSAWGEFKIEDKKATLSVLYGELVLKEFGLGEGIEFDTEPRGKLSKKGNVNLVGFDNMVSINHGEEIVFELK